MPIMSEKLDSIYDDRKGLILKTATTLFSKHGLNGVSIRQISKATGCNLAAISYYFGGKEKLYAECLSSLDPQILEGFVEILQTPTNKEELQERLLNFTHQFCEFVSAHADAVRMLVNEMNQTTVESVVKEKNFISPILQNLEAFLSAAQEKEIVNKEVDPQLITVMIFSGVVTQIIYSRFRSFHNISHRDFAEKIVRNCTGSFYA